MSDTASVLKYLQGMAFERKPCSEPASCELPFITVSRQAGAGGRSLAEAILKEMESRREEPLFKGWQVFDQELCAKVAEDPKVRASLDALLSEKFYGELEDYLVQMFAKTSPQRLVHRRVFAAIRSLAAVGKAVIVGRGGASLTSDYPRGVHVRLVAPLEHRVRRVAERFSMDREEAGRWVAEQDSFRARLVRDYFRADIEDPLLYDAVWNTERVRLEDVAASVLTLVQKKAGRTSHALS